MQIFFTYLSITKYMHILKYTIFFTLVKVKFTSLKFSDNSLKAVIKKKISYFPSWSFFFLEKTNFSSTLSFVDFPCLNLTYQLVTEDNVSPLCFASSLTHLYTSIPACIYQHGYLAAFSRSVLDIQMKPLQHHVLF